MYKPTEFSTIEFCRQDILYEETVCDVMDDFFAYKKVRFSNSTVASWFHQKTRQDQRGWNGVYLADIALDGWDIPGQNHDDRWITMARTFLHSNADEILRKVIGMEIKALAVDFILLEKDICELQDFLERVPRQIDILINPVFLGPAEKIYDFVSTLNDVFRNLQSKYNENLMLPARMIKRAALLKHPCNAYICNGVHCHSQKSGYPRHIFVREDRKIVPESSDLRDNYIIYDLSNPVTPFAFDTKALDAFKIDMKWLFKTFAIGSEHQVIPIATILPFVGELRTQMP